MMEEKNAAGKFLKEMIPSIFTYALLGAAAAGWIFDRFVPREYLRYAEGTFFSIGTGGLQFEGIFQIFGLSVVLGVLLLIFMSEIFLSKYMLVWRYLFFLTSALVAISVFVVIFRWFPPNVWQGWVMLLATFAIFSSVSMIPNFIKIKREDKEYEKALSDYKQKKDEDSRNAEEN